MSLITIPSLILIYFFTKDEVVKKEGLLTIKLNVGICRNLLLCNGCHILFSGSPYHFYSCFFLHNVWTTRTPPKSWCAFRSSGGTSNSCVLSQTRDAKRRIWRTVFVVSIEQMKRNKIFFTNILLWIIFKILFSGETFTNELV